MSNFTKGEWIVDHSAFCIEVYAGDISVAEMYLGDEGCYMSDDYCHETVEQNEQMINNAHLVAAAPDLYNALENLLEICHASPIGEQERRAAIKALAKAKGEEHVQKS